MINDKADEVKEEPCEPLLNRYEKSFEKLIKDSEFIFDYVHLLYYKGHEINLYRGRSYIRSQETKKQQYILSIIKIIKAFNTLQHSKNHKHSEIIKNK